MPTYTYTHGSTDPTYLARLLLGDHRGTPGAADGWLFSDEEIDLLLDLADSDPAGAVRIALHVRANREALAASVTGTTDTSERPGAITQRITSWQTITIAGQVPAAAQASRSPEDLGDTGAV